MPQPYLPPVFILQIFLSSVRGKFLHIKNACLRKSSQIYVTKFKVNSKLSSDIWPSVMTKYIDTLRWRSYSIATSNLLLSSWEVLCNISWISDENLQHEFQFKFTELLCQQVCHNCFRWGISIIIVDIKYRKSLHKCIPVIPYCHHKVLLMCVGTCDLSISAASCGCFMPVNWTKFTTMHGFVVQMTKAITRNLAIFCKLCHIDHCGHRCISWRFQLMTMLVVFMSQILIAKRKMFHWASPKVHTCPKVHQATEVP